ncbi:hypothetical protein BP00DRAFT_423207 [Aspergillus indologenus CBS 114.80]|uniref:CENP-V/GFA domain-containing protein n=1 Tax=Aspergillus indologenus CBS 114.80 TaxID=1450541 RepID=A0A2V5IDQ5_9EURO|nr:hypothetical protein BP00DRAFT_423207 [Aspergillus indologenus CBS 114.80]
MTPAHLSAIAAAARFDPLYVPYISNLIPHGPHPLPITHGLTTTAVGPRCSSQKAFGTNYGLTAKVPKDALTLKSGQPKEFVGDNGSGSTIHREFCGDCGSFILEYGDAVKNDFRYICVGTLDDPEVLPPKGEFFCESRSNWMPEIPDVFHKQKIKE